METGSSRKRSSSRRNQSSSISLLRVEYNKIRRMLVAGTYSPARQVIRRGIRRAVKHKAYRSLCSMYFIASALYYEDGRLTSGNEVSGQDDSRGHRKRRHQNWVYDYNLRYAYIYEKLGLYGNAIETAEHVVRAVRRDIDRQLQYLTALIAVFDNLVIINSRRADEIVPELIRAAQKDRRLVTASRSIIGRLVVTTSGIPRFEKALSEFETAEELFFEHRNARRACVEPEMARASLLIAQDRLEEADKVLSASGTGRRGDGIK